jgi:hypothetical protein
VTRAPLVIFGVIPCTKITINTSTKPSHNAPPMHSQRSMNPPSFSIHYSTAKDEGVGAYIRNCTNITASSTIVPRDPINQGRFVIKYSFSKECARIPAPYVKLPISERRKNKRASPVRRQTILRKGIIEFTYPHRTYPDNSS